METSSKALLEEEQMFMEKAFAFAKEALDNQEVPVGCIFVYEKEVVAVGRNEVNESKNATRHAEMICIDHVTKYYKDNQLELKEVFRKIDIYVTVEPCIMCAAALYDLSVRSVTFGCKNDRFGGSTVLDVAQVLKPSTLIKGGYKADEAMKLLKDFYKGQNPNAPAAKVKKKY
uniref:CMP/dCMP-type deaminase domain-containing protein n=1 Tax=Dendroctonus ponderosae TaxID=77166 RepID=A0AAR5PAP4_DENPD